MSGQNIMLPIESEILFGLGDGVHQIMTHSLGFELPSEVVDQLNNKAHFNSLDELVFDHEGFSGRLGHLSGELEWNDGKNKAFYVNFISEDGLSGSHTYSIGGEHEEIAREFFSIQNWETYLDQGCVSWEVDPMNMKASVSSVETMNGTNQNNTVSFVTDTRLAVEAEANEESLNIVFTPSLKLTGVNAARLSAPEMLAHLPEEAEDIDYTGTLALEIPSLANCENYFSGLNFDKDSQCQINIESSDLPTEIVLKMKHKFAFIRAGEFMAYVRSERRNGEMVGFDKVLYLSFYLNEKVEGRSFNAIKQKPVSDLIVTIPLENAFIKEISPAVMAYAKKWEKFSNKIWADAPKSIVKAVYWMDKWAPTAQDSTFDFSDIAAATRFGGFFGELTNEDIQEGLKAMAEEVALFLQNHEYPMVVAMREFVNDIVRAEKEATKKFALPA